MYYTPLQCVHIINNLQSLSPVWALFFTRVCMCVPALRSVLKVIFTHRELLFCG